MDLSGIFLSDFTFGFIYGVVFAGIVFCILVVRSMIVNKVVKETEIEKIYTELMTANHKIEELRDQKLKAWNVPMRM